MKIYGNEMDLTKKEFQKKAIDYILIKHFKDEPFFSNLLLNSSDVEDISKKNPNALAYTYFNFKNERIKICLNFDKIVSLSLNESDIFSVMLHELLHNYFEHLSRFKDEMKKYPQLTNYILDYYINDFLLESYKPFKHLESKLGLINYDELNNLAIILTGQNLPFYKNSKDRPIDSVLLQWFLENIKDDILKTLQESNIRVSFNNLDDHEIAKEEEANSLKELNEEKIENGETPYSDSMSELIKTSFLKAKAMETKGCGFGSDGFFRTLEDVYRKDTFLDFIKIKNGIKSMCRKHNYMTYSRANRKKIIEDVVYKGKRFEDGFKLVVAIDVSGSITDKELQIFYDMLSTFLKTGEGENVADIIYWSSMELDEKNLHRNIVDYKELKKLQIVSDGGTEVKTLYRFIEKTYKKEKIALLNITDGFWRNYALPGNVIDYFLALINSESFEDKANYYRKAKVRIYDRI